VVARTSALRPLKRSLMPFGLWRSWFGQAMFDAVGGVDAIKRVGTRGLALAGGTEAVDKFLTIIGEDLGDREGGLVDQAREETAGRGG